ncbi:MAG TPA: sugar phosphate isomerase/epimerase [Firmicutes bacterium]|nr:sugar phosphate isomerase/epimerase [Bacillota bacterium]
MKIGLRMPSMRNMLGDKGVIAWAAEAGLEAIDLLTADQEIAAEVKAKGLTLGSIDSAGRKGILSPDPNEQAQGIKEACERIAQIKAVGGSILFEVFVPADPFQPRAKSFAIWKETYPEVVRAAEEHGVKIAVEPWPGPEPTLPNLGTNPEMLRAMFEAIPSPSFGLCYDPSHFVRLGIDHIRLLEEFKDRVFHVHAKDCQIIPEGMYLVGTLGETFGKRYRHGSGSWRYCIPGRGNIDWAEVIFHLAANGYDGILAIELEDHQFLPEVEKQQRGISQAAAYLAELL